MYSRNQRRVSEDGLTEEEREIARYGLPPKYDGTRFRRNRAPVQTDDGPFVDEPADPGEERDDYPPLRRGSGTEGADADGDADGDGDGGKLSKLVEGLGERLGSEEMIILALILLLSGTGGDCENPSDVILLLALLLLTGRERPGQPRPL